MPKHGQNAVMIPSQKRIHWIATLSLLVVFACGGLAAQEAKKKKKPPVKFSWVAPMP